MADLAPQTATEVAQFLASLARQLAELTKEIGTADRQAVHARERYVQYYAQTWRKLNGAVENRKQECLALTGPARLTAEEADARVRDLRRQIDAVKVRIDVGRSYGAAVRAEIELVKSPFTD